MFSRPRLRRIAALYQRGADLYFEDRDRRQEQTCGRDAVGPLGHIPVRFAGVGLAPLGDDVGIQQLRSIGCTKHLSLLAIEPFEFPGQNQVLHSTLEITAYPSALVVVQTIVIAVAVRYAENKNAEISLYK